MQTRKFLCEIRKSDVVDQHLHRHLSPLQAINSLRLVTQCGLRQAKNIVDGKKFIINDMQLMELVQKHTNSAREASLGLGVSILLFETLINTPVEIVYKNNHQLEISPTGYSLYVLEEV